jgi:hypothetical protein
MVGSIIKDLPNIFRDFAISFALMAFSKHSGSEIPPKSGRMPGTTPGGAEIRPMHPKELIIRLGLPAVKPYPGRRVPTKPI